MLYYQILLQLLLLSYYDNCSIIEKILSLLFYIPLKLDRPLLYYCYIKRFIYNNMTLASCHVIMYNHSRPQIHHNITTTYNVCTSSLSRFVKYLTFSKISIHKIPIENPMFYTLYTIRNQQSPFFYII